MKYLLDTNVVSQLLRRDRQVTTRLRYHARAEVTVSAIALSELWAGIAAAPDQRLLMSNWEKLGFEILDFDAADARCSAEVRAQLWRLGRPIGPLDTLIAGQAIARELILVTHNTREFERVPGLRIEGWEA